MSSARTAVEAVLFGTPDELAVFLAAGEGTETPMLYACMHNMHHHVRTLLAHSATPTPSDVYNTCSFFGAETLGILLDSGLVSQEMKDKLLYHCAVFDFVSHFRALVIYGANPAKLPESLVEICSGEIYEIIKWEEGNRCGNSPMVQDEG